MNNGSNSDPCFNPRFNPCLDIPLIFLFHFFYLESEFGFLMKLVCHHVDYPVYKFDDF